MQFCEDLIDLFDFLAELSALSELVSTYQISEGFIQSHALPHMPRGEVFNEGLIQCHLVDKIKILYMINKALATDRSLRCLVSNII